MKYILEKRNFMDINNKNIYYPDLNKLKQDNEKLQEHITNTQTITKSLTLVLDEIRELVHSTYDFEELMNRIIKEASKAVGCQSSAISFREDKYWVVRYIYGFPKEMIGTKMSDVQDPHAVLAVESKQPVFIEDAYKDERANNEHMKKWKVQSVIVVPLLTRNSTIGVIYFNYYEKVNKFHEPVIKFIKGFSLSISLALHNIKLFEDAQNEIKIRKNLEEELRSQKDLFEAVIDNFSDPFIILDKDRNIIKKNMAAQNSFPNINNAKTKDDLILNIDFFDLNGNTLSLFDLPIEKAYKGDYIKNEVVVLKYSNKIYICEISATPIYDINKNLISVAVLNRDITEKIVNQQKLKEQHEEMIKIIKEKNQALKKTIEIKDEFIALFSHEFKTPLTVIKSAIQSIEFFCKGTLPDRAHVYFNKIKQNSNRQLRLVNNLLDITRLDAGRLRLHKKNLDIVFLTKSITESISSYSEQKKISLTFTTNLKRKIIGIDEEKYERILLNLLSNAVKFTPEGKNIVVKMFEKMKNKKKFLCLQVIDKGIGIPLDMQNMIFERFNQVDNSLTRQADGTGIGLYLVKLLIKMLGGEIHLESTPGEGSTFTVLLPMDKVCEVKKESHILEKADKRLIESIAVEFSDIYF